jgi:Meiotically up-regulated gene 113
MKNQDIGTIYVLVNRDGSLTKIGLTRTGSPEARATDYERAHGICWPVVYWSCTTDDVAGVEARIHRVLQDRRFSLTPEAREIFHCTPHHAVRIAERFVIPAPGTNTPQQARPLRFVRRSPWLRSAEIAAAVAVTYWPAFRRLRRLLRAR